MIPGFSGIADSDNLNEKMFIQFKIIIQSMTPYERANPNKIDKSRKDNCRKVVVSDI